MTPTNTEIEMHLVELRRIYIESYPKQRLNVAKQRLKNPNHDPNLLITHVSVIEGFARSVAMHLHANTKEELSQIYDDYKRRSPEELVEEVVRAKKNMSASSYIGEQDWQMFRYSVQYRNLLVHECTYLGQDTTPILLDACAKVLDALEVLSGLAPDE